MKALHISRKCKCDHCTAKKFVAYSEHIQVHADKGTMEGGRFLPDNIIREQLLKFHRKVANRYLQFLEPLESHAHQGVGSSRGSFGETFYSANPKQCSEAEMAAVGPEIH